MLMLVLYGSIRHTGNIRWQGFISVKEVAQVTVEEYSLRIEHCTHATEIVPVRVEPGKVFSSSCMHFAPMWSPLVTLENLLDMIELRTIGHAPVHVYGDIC